MNSINRRVKFLKELVDNSDLRYTTFNFEEFGFFILEKSKYSFSSVKFSGRESEISELVGFYPKEEDLNEGVLDLYKKESVEALFILTEEEKYRYFAIQFFSEFHKSVLVNYLERIWNVIQKYSISNPELLLTMFEIEGRSSKTIPILQDMNRSMMLHHDLKEQFEEILLKFKIEDGFSALRDQLDTVGREELTNSLNTIESAFEKRIKLVASGLERKHNDLLKQIREHDTVVTEERKEGLQKQIDYLKGDIETIRERANDKITIKDEFAGAWKVIISLSFLASLVLIVLKIIEAIQNIGQ